MHALPARNQVNMDGTVLPETVVRFMVHLAFTVLQKLIISAANALQ
jgi:hypothetical protein